MTTSGSTVLETVETVVTGELNKTVHTNTSQTVYFGPSDRVLSSYERLKKCVSFCCNPVLNNRMKQLDKLLYASQGINYFSIKCRLEHVFQHMIFEMQGMIPKFELEDKGSYTSILEKLQSLFKDKILFQEITSLNRLFSISHSVKCVSEKCILEMIRRLTIFVDIWTEVSVDPEIYFFLDHDSSFDDQESSTERNPVFNRKRTEAEQTTDKEQAYDSPPQKKQAYVSRQSDKERIVGADQRSGYLK